MRIVAKKILREFWENYSDSEHQLKTWHKETSKADWKNPTEIKAKYSKASILKSGRVVFNICRNKYRLVVELIQNMTTCLVGRQVLTLIKSRNHGRKSDKNRRRL